MAKPVEIVFQSVTVRYGENVILENVTGKIPRGHITAIIGPNGAGKTTLLLAILGAITFEGVIDFLDENAKKVKPVISYVPQNLHFNRYSPITVLEFLALDLQIEPIWFGVNKKVRELCVASLMKLKADHLMNKPLAKLSGGEKQRVLLAKAIQKDPDLILLDEPVSGVDLVGGHLFCDVIEELRKQQQPTILMVSHDLSVVSQQADYVLCLNRSIACEGEIPKVLSSEILKNLYGETVGLHKHHAFDAGKFCNNHVKDSNNA